MATPYETEEQKFAYMRTEYGPPTHMRLTQFGDLDLEFEGWKVGSSDAARRVDRTSVDVDVFYTSRGCYVAQITRHMPNLKGPTLPPVKKSKAQAFISPVEMLAWLRDDGRGWLGENSKVAWEETCAKLPWLHEKNTIRV